MSVAAAIGATISERLDVDVHGVASVAGGDINDAFRVETSGGPLFVKTRAGAAAGEFRQEAAGLVWLGEAKHGPPVPEVVLVHDDEGMGQPAVTGPRFLALRWVEPGAALGSAVGEEQLGRALARLHASGASSWGSTPVLRPKGSLAFRTVHAPFRMGPVTLLNAPCDSFAEFFAQRRVLPLTELAVARGAFDSEQAALMHRIAERLPELAGPSEPPARTHGDLWSGNVLRGADGRSYLIDPAAHGGHREVDLATLRVFGGPGERLFAAYDEIHPLADGWADRVALWQLGIILLHVALFGGAYAGQAVALARRYA